MQSAKNFPFASSFLLTHSIVSLSLIFFTSSGQFLICFFCVSPASGAANRTAHLHFLSIFSFSSFSSLCLHYYPCFALIVKLEIRANMLFFFRGALLFLTSQNCFLVFKSNNCLHICDCTPVGGWSAQSNDNNAPGVACLPPTPLFLSLFTRTGHSFLLGLGQSGTRLYLTRVAIIVVLVPASGLCFVRISAFSNAHAKLTDGSIDFQLFTHRWKFSSSLHKSSLNVFVISHTEFFNWHFKKLRRTQLTIFGIFCWVLLLQSLRFPHLLHCLILSPAQGQLTAAGEKIPCQPYPSTMPDKALIVSEF